MANAAHSNHTPFFRRHHHTQSHPRTMGAFSVFLFGAASIGVLFAGFMPYSTLAGMWPGSDMLKVLCVALGFCLIHAFTYVAIGSAAPRSGADYTLASRVLSAPLAFASSLLFILASGVIAGLFASSISQELIPAMVKSIAIVNNMPGLNSTFAFVATAESTTLIGALVILTAFGTLILPVKGTTRVLQLTLSLSVVAWLMVLFQVAFPSQSIILHWDSLMSTGTFSEQVNIAKSMGMTTTPWSGNFIVAGLFASLVVFFGYFTPTYVSSEVRQPSKNLLIGVLSAVAVSGVLIIGGCVLVSRVAKPEWFSAQSYLSTQPTYDGAMPWLVFYANLLRPSLEVSIFEGAAWILSLFSMIQVLLFYCSRVLAAWAQDDLFPELIAYQHPVLRSPIIALMCMSAIAQVSVTASALGNSLITLKGFVLVTAFSQILPVIALIVFPFSRKEWFERMPGWVRFKLGPLPIISLSGVISLVYLVAVVAAGFIPGAGFSYNTGAIVGLLVIFGLAIAWYYIRRSFLARSQQRLEDHFADLPVEE